MEIQKDDIQPAATSLFTIEDISRAIGEVNYNKGLGTDAFDGHVLSLSPELREKLATEITEVLNAGRIPQH
jgi:uncharacterized protein (DUF2164 family)